MFIPKYHTGEKIAAYAKKVFNGWQISFAMTTNGVGLTADVIRFLVENNVNLMISLDGPIGNHDAKRVFRDGSGSLGILMKNIEKLSGFDSNYYHQQVSFSVVYSKDLSLRAVYDFFEQNDLVNKNIVSFAFVNHFDTDYFEKYPYDEALFRKDMDWVLDKVTDKKRNKAELTPIDESFFRDINDLRKKLKKKQLTTLAETCLFNNRLYVDATGQFHACEKMNDTFPIGNVEDGFDFDRMVQILQEFSQLIKNHCTHCDVRFLCSRCFIHFAKNGEFVMRKEFCEKKKKKFNVLNRVIQLIEEGVLN